MDTKAGDWVCNGDRVAKVKEVYEASEYSSPRGSFDLIFYEPNGTKIGRDSPAMGGPRGFEPMCCRSNWRRIATPEFPVDIVYRPMATLDVEYLDE